MKSIRRFRGYLVSLQYPLAFLAALQTVSCDDNTGSPRLSTDAGDAGHTGDASTADPTSGEPASSGVDTSNTTDLESTDGISAETSSDGASDLDASASTVINTQTDESDDAVITTDATSDTAHTFFDASHSDGTRPRSDARVASTDVTTTDVTTTEVTSAGVASTDVISADDGGVCEPRTEPLVKPITRAMHATLDAAALNIHDAGPWDAALWDAASWDAALWDAGDAAAGDADSADGTCFPSCVTELEALCLPSGACSWTPDYGGACWENGLDMDQQLVFSETPQVISQLRVGAQSCYQVIYENPPDGAPNTITWKNSCNQVVAIAIQTGVEAATYDVNCTDTNETTTVSLASPACSKYVNGAPSTDGCDGFECPIAGR